jgi:hypothetical protein
MRRICWLLLAALPALAQDFAPSPFFFGQKGSPGRTSRSDDSLYDSGTRSLDGGRWDAAAETFGRVVELKGTHAEGALYWKAYAENKLNQRDAALATLAALRKDFPSSRWLDDAKALEVEIHQQAGQPVNPNSESNDELKMYALNGLLQSDPEQAIPIIEKLLKSNNSPKLKDRALFVLTQSRSAKAQQLLIDAAKGSVNPDLQIRALRYIATSGGAENRNTLYTIYTSSNDIAVKKAILNYFIMSKFTGPNDPLANIAKNEKNPELRREAIRKLGIGPRGQTSDLLVTLYGPEQDPDIKKEIVNSLFIQGSAKPLVDVARKETNPALKQEIVQKLSMMHSKDATDYMVEILSK